MPRRIYHRFAEALTPWGRRTFYSDVLAQSALLIIMSGGTPQHVSDLISGLLTALPDDRFEVYHPVWSPFLACGVFLLDRQVAIFPSAIIEPDVLGSLPAIVHRIPLEIPPTTWPRVPYRASRMLALAKNAHDEMEDLIGPYVMSEAVASARQQLVSFIPHRSAPSSCSGKIRHFFGGSLTVNGLIDFLSEEFDSLNQRIYFQGTFGLDHTSLIRWFGERASLAGVDVDFYHCEWDSSRVDHLGIPGLGLGVTLGTAPHAITPRATDLIIDMNEWLGPHSLELLPLLQAYQMGVNRALTHLAAEALFPAADTSNPPSTAHDVRVIEKILSWVLILS